MSPRCFRSWPKTRWKRFRAIVKRHDDKLVAQRLGYLLDKVGRRDLSRALSTGFKKPAAA